ncbi:MAG: extracellular solute-binding protein [Pseudooceanicola sp.]|nr:extracellular solute-binding protein [Pseudooceanicola sp.]
MNRLKFIDRMSQGRVSRREMMKAAAAFGVSATLLPRAGRAAEMLTCLEWGGYDDPAYFPAFMAKHGVQPNFSVFSGEEEALAKVLAGFAADIMHPCNYSVARFVTAGLTKPIDTARLSHWNDVFPVLKDAEGVVVNGDVVMAPADWGNASVAYRPDLVEKDFLDAPTWGILYDERYKGRVSTLDDALVIQIGLMVEGKSYDEVYNLHGDELRAAAETWGRKGLETARFLWTDATELQQAMASGEIVAAYAWNDVIGNLKEQGIPVAYAVPKEGFFTWFCGLSILNSGKADEAAAYDFVDAWLSPETGKLLIEGSGYGHANTKSFEIADAEAVAAMGLDDPIAMMANSTVFRTPDNAVQEDQNKVWEDLKATHF